MKDIKMLNSLVGIGAGMICVFIGFVIAPIIKQYWLEAFRPPWYVRFWRWLKSTKKPVGKNNGEKIKG